MIRGKRDRELKGKVGMNGVSGILVRAKLNDCPINEGEKDSRIKLS